jgi:hypothetical protein
MSNDTKDESHGDEMEGSSSNSDDEEREDESYDPTQDSVLTKRRRIAGVHPVCGFSFLTQLPRSV